jgi:hypothetical protein
VIPPVTNESIAICMRLLGYLLEPLLLPTHQGHDVIGNRWVEGIAYALCNPSPTSSHPTSFSEVFLLSLYENTWNNIHGDIS